MVITVNEQDSNIVYVDGIEYNLNNSEHINILSNKFVFRPKMSEQKFFAMCDALDEIPFKDVGDDYLPTEEELKRYNVENNLEKYIPYLVYLSENYTNKEYLGYKKFRKYVNSLIEKYLD